MPRPRTCPHCKELLAFQNGYTYDHELNVRCGKCGKIVFPSTPTAETELLKIPPNVHNLPLVEHRS